MGAQVLSAHSFIGGSSAGVILADEPSFREEKAYRKFIWKKKKKGVDKMIPIVYNIINPRGKELILWRF